MRFLSALLILLTSSLAYSQTVPNVASGIRLPSAIEATADNKTVKISPTFDDASKVISIKFIVLGTGKTQPTVKTDALSVEVSTPKTIDEVILVYCYGTMQGASGPVLSDPVATVITLHGGEPIPPPPNGGGNPPPPPPPPPPNPPPVDQVFASVKNIQFFLIVDVQSANREVAVLTQNRGFFKQHIEQPNTGNKTWVYDVRATELRTTGVITKITDAQGKVTVPLPCILLFDSTTKPAKQVGTVMPVTLTGDATADANTILATAANALKK